MIKYLFLPTLPFYVTLHLFYLLILIIIFYVDDKLKTKIVSKIRTRNKRKFGIRREYQLPQFLCEILKSSDKKELYSTLRPIYSLLRQNSHLYLSLSPVNFKF